VIAAFVGSFIGVSIILTIRGFINRRRAKQKEALTTATQPQPQPALDLAPLTAALATLQDLRAKNLITEEEYQAKRKAHLDQL
jgi:hypothetical protein